MATSDCEKILELIPLYLDNMLSDEENDMVREHIENCLDCEKELSFMKAVMGSAHTLTAPNLPADFHEKLMEQVEKEVRPVRKNYRAMLRRSFMSVAAAAAVVALSVVSFLNLEMGSDTVNPDQFTKPNPTAQVQNTPDFSKEEQAAAPVGESEKVKQNTKGKSTPKKVVEKQAEKAETPVVVSETEQAEPFAYRGGRMAESEDVPTALAEDEGVFAVAETPKTEFVKVFVTVAETDVSLAETILQEYPKDQVGYLVEDGLEDVLLELSNLSGYAETREYSEELSGNYIVLE